MSRSKILIDLVNNTNNLESVLLRLKVILSKLENETINNWINCEIEGYKKGDTIPPYRIIRGNAIGNYYLGGMEYKNYPVPLKFAPRALSESILNTMIKDGIRGIFSLIESKEKIGKSFPPEICARFSRDDIKLYVSEMNVTYGVHQLDGILAAIRNKLTDIVIKLENDFGNIDSLDIITNETDKEIIKEVEHFIINEFHLDKSITIGDNNKIKDTHVVQSGGVNEN
ncbi:hypothetical protein GLW07_18910 [Bacillus hwajinpoensis]|uniref:AbiTii domain-containing protein n=1 Tax=Guptibacillus hwajinpoensis TaxID=208199 RepID=A0A845F393_9BACL|nr:hypothetical protein [Pseudalkalibacillus hwajinpoensis]MYL65433.1 hypothetical protein [Pseudalkalibacillus hwajinpoensis]